jgi:hypothetical protein
MCVELLSGGAAEGEHQDADEHHKSRNQEDKDAMLQGLNGHLARLGRGPIAHGAALGERRRNRGNRQKANETRNAAASHQLTYLRKRPSRQARIS